MIFLARHCIVYLLYFYRFASKTKIVDVVRACKRFRRTIITREIIIVTVKKDRMTPKISALIAIVPMKISSSTILVSFCCLWITDSNSSIDFSDIFVVISWTIGSLFLAVVFEMLLCERFSNGTTIVVKFSSFLLSDVAGLLKVRPDFSILE